MRFFATFITGKFRNAAAEGNKEANYTKDTAFVHGLSGIVGVHNCFDGVAHMVFVAVIKFGDLDMLVFDAVYLIICIDGVGGANISALEVVFDVDFDIHNFGIHLITIFLGFFVFGWLYASDQKE